MPFIWMLAVPVGGQYDIDKVMGTSEELELTGKYIRLLEQPKLPNASKSINLYGLTDKLFLEA